MFYAFDMGFTPFHTEFTQNIKDGGPNIKG